MHVCLLTPRSNIGGPQWGTAGGESLISINSTPMANHAGKEATIITGEMIQSYARIYENKKNRWRLFMYKTAHGNKVG